MRSAILPGCLQERVPLPPALLLVRAGLSGLPLPTVAQRALFASDGEDGYATWTPAPFSCTQARRPLAPIQVRIRQPRESVLRACSPGPDGLPYEACGAVSHALRFLLLPVPREAGDRPPLRPLSCSQVREDGSGRAWSPRLREGPPDVRSYVGGDGGPDA